MSSRIIDRMKYICRKAVDRTKDSFFNFTHAQLIRNMVTASELDLVKREPCDRDLVLIAFYPTGGFGDYIISYCCPYHAGLTSTVKVPCLEMPFMAHGLALRCCRMKACTVTG